MKTAAVRYLRNHYSELLNEVAAGEEIIITKRGKPVAKLGPVDRCITEKVDWSVSAEVRRERGKGRRLIRSERDEVLQGSSGRW